MTSMTTLKIATATAAIALSGAASAAVTGLGDAYTLDAGHTGGNGTYTFTYTVGNLNQGAVYGQTGLDGFTILIPVDAHVDSYSVPSAPRAGGGYWTGEAAAQLTIGGDGHQDVTAPAGYKTFTWWGQYTEAVYEPGTSAQFSITLSNVSVGTNAVGVTTYFGWSNPGDQDYSTIQYGNYTTFKQAGVLSAVTAVPEPETYAMMLAGLGLVGLMARRKAGKA